MVDFLDFFVTNISYFSSIGFSTLIVLTSYLLYRRTENNGFIVILVGECIGLLWFLFYLLILQGAYLPVYLDQLELSNAMISIVYLTLNAIGIGINLIRSLALVTGLYFISQELPRKNVY